ncbi:MAG: hypothetical protein ACRC51_05950 [Cetobacterium sp.]
MYKCKYFKLQELVCPDIYKQYGDSAWEFFDQNFLKDLDGIRELFNTAIIINNWHIGGSYKESGLRCALCNEVKKHTLKGKVNMSAHKMNGADLKLKGIEIKKAVETIVNNAHRFKTIKRIENPDYTPTWLHVDTRGHHEGIKIFNP